MATISPSFIQILIVASTNLRLKTQSCCKYFLTRFEFTRSKLVKLLYYELNQGFSFLSLTNKY